MTDGWQRTGPEGPRRARREAARRRRRRRRRVLIACLAAVAAILLVLISLSLASSGSPRHPAGTPAPSHTSVATSTTATSTTRAIPARSTAGPGPTALLERFNLAQGRLAQNEARPSARTGRFRELMAALWRGITTNTLAPALPAFFPKGAYEQLKAIYGAGSDWTNRLVRDYRLDISAAHALLGAGAAHARLLSVEVPASFAHWVPPGVCSNSIGYYETPNSRVVYSAGGSVHSLGIASLISWRGVWYVVHLGAILRPGEGGTVDQPSAGRGTAVYSGTC